MEFTAEAIRRAERVRLIIFDVDGVLTDGGIYIGPDGELFKPFFCRDGLGITLAHRAGLYLHLGWVYRSAGDEAHEQEAMRHAAELYDQSIMKEHYPQGAMTRSLPNRRMRKGCWCARCHATT